jgi:hypothetical protein
MADEVLGRVVVIKVERQVAAVVMLVVCGDRKCAGVMRLDTGLVVVVENPRSGW